MPTNRDTLLCRYHYDPLDRLADCTPSTQANTQRFYLKTRLATEIQGSAQRSIFQQEDQLLAQQQHQDGTVETTLLTTDQQRSVVNALDATQPHPLTYTPYGHRPPDGGLLSLLGFNGERPDPVTGHYVLGNGYRAFNPVLMRFNSPDSWSPFGEGGLNCYAYCLGDPVNEVEPNGHSPYNAIQGISKFSLSANKNINPILKVSRTGLGRTTKTNIMTLAGDMSDIQSPTPGITIFRDKYKGNYRWNFVGHGTEKPIDGYHRILTEEGTLTPKQLYESAINSGVNIGESKNIRLVMCYSANGGSASFAQRFSDVTGIPVKGFINPLSVDPGVDSLGYMIQQKSSRLRQRSDGSFSYREMKIFKTNPYPRGTKEHRLFSYQPVKFHPRKI